MFQVRIVLRSKFSLAFSERAFCLLELDAVSVFVMYGGFPSYSCGFSIMV